MRVQEKDTAALLPRNLPSSHPSPTGAVADDTIRLIIYRRQPHSTSPSAHPRQGRESVGKTKVNCLARRYSCRPSAERIAGQLH